MINKDLIIVVGGINLRI